MRRILALTLVAALALSLPALAGASDLDKWRSSTPHTWSRADHHPSHRTNVVVVPTPVYVFPSRCWVDGYWNYAWVPQVSPYNVWVEGAWAPDGSWIDGHYEQGASSSGYWQPYWVEGRWSAC